MSTLDGVEDAAGLLSVWLKTCPASGTHFVCYDGNGNVWNLVSATSGAEPARYEYGPFGEALRLSGPGAKANPFRFSTKRTEDFTGLVLYEYRAYSPTSGRWLSRDPVEHSAGQAVTIYCGNHPVGAVDVLGLWYDSITAYYRSCAHMHCLGNRPYGECVCAPVSGSIASKDCVDKCTRCARGLSKGSRGQISLYDMCVGAYWPTRERAEPAV